MGCRAAQLWLATSADRRVSVWSADWSRDLCELVDWLTFPAPAYTTGETDVATYGMVNFYISVDLLKKFIVRTYCYIFLNLMHNQLLSYLNLKLERTMLG